jgi:hypothetical protein
MPTEALVVAATPLRRPRLISSSSKTGVSVGARFLALRQRRYERSPPPARPESRREEAPFQWDHGRDKNGIDDVDFS